MDHRNQLCSQSSKVVQCGRQQDLPSRERVMGWLVEASPRAIMRSSRTRRWTRFQFLRRSFPIRASSGQSTPARAQNVGKRSATRRDRSRRPVHTRAHTELCAEGAVEIRDIAETAIECDIQDSRQLNPKPECRAP